MDRRAFVASLIAAVGVAELAHVAPALAELDEFAIGSDVYDQLRESGDLLFDSSYYEHLNEIGSVIAEAVRPRYPYPISYFVVRGTAANAFSVPGGNIYVNEPLLRLAKNRDELAGVLAHETGHMVKHHVAKRLAEQQKASVIGTIGQIAGSIFGGFLGAQAAGAALDAGAARVDANLARKIEAEADEEGARIMAATKIFNPYGMVWFFDIMSATYGPGQKNWVNSHPLDAERIADLNHLLATNPDVFGAWKDTGQKDAAYW